jgi:hypothetical protein
MMPIIARSVRTGLPQSEYRKILNEGYTEIKQKMT